MSNNIATLRHPHKTSDGVEDFKREIGKLVQRGSFRKLRTYMMQYHCSNSENERLLESRKKIAGEVVVERCLGNLRKQVPLSQYRSYHVLSSMFRDNFYFGKITRRRAGISEDEMRRFRKAATREYPLHVLSDMEGSPPETRLLNNLLRALSRAAMQLSDIGLDSNFEEQYKLRVARFKGLDYALKIASGPSLKPTQWACTDAHLPRDIYRFIEHNGLTLEEIGTSEAQIEWFRREYARLYAKATIRRLLHHVDESYKAKLRGIIRQHAFTFRDLNLAEEDLERVLSKR